MKIGILTLPPYANYGGILQAYALQTILEREGHEVSILTTPHKFRKPNYREYPKRILKKLSGKRVIVQYEKRIKEEAPVVFGQLFRFINDRIKTYCINGFSELNENSFDCYIVGSDQIWRPVYFKNLWSDRLEDAFLSFTQNWPVKRISYAASLGVDTWELTEEETNRCKEAAQLFDAISVREKSAVSLLMQYLTVNAVFVLDPTMLLSAVDYCSLLSQNNSTRQRGLLNYILDITDEKRTLVETIAVQKGMSTFSVTNTMVDSNAPVCQRIMPSVENWLQGFVDADFVVTDSFHACVFSIIFRKPFVVIGNKNRGLERFYSLLQHLGLEDHLISSSDDFSEIKDYSIPNNAYVKLDKLREFSTNFLKNALEK